MATVVGFYAVSLPFFMEDHALSKASNYRFNSYYTYGRMLIKLAEAIGRLVLAGREMTRLAGLTTRVIEIKDVLGDINSGRYERTMICDFKDESIGSPGEGKIVNKDNIIRFEHVPLVTPNGDILIKELSFEVKSGMNVLVCGPNGCGKSSLFRILGEVSFYSCVCVFFFYQFNFTLHISNYVILVKIVMANLEWNNYQTSTRKIILHSSASLYDSGYVEGSSDLSSYKDGNDETRADDG